MNVLCASYANSYSQYYSYNSQTDNLASSLHCKNSISPIYTISNVTIIEENIFQYYTKQNNVKLKNGIVYLKHVESGEFRLVKRIPKSTPIEPYLMLSQTLHPNIATPTEIFLYQQYYYIVFEKPPGRNLRNILESDELRGDIKSALEITAQLLSICKFLNAHALMHRNLNPEILWLNTHNNRITLLDCGTCCAKDTHVKKVTTNLLFSSPEMARFNSPYNEKTDIFSIGVILFSLLYGHGPYKLSEESSVEDLQHKVCHSIFISVKDRARPLERNLLKYLNLFLFYKPEERSDPDFYLNHEYMINNRFNDSDDVISNQAINYIKDFSKNHLFSSLVGIYFRLYDEIEVNKLFTLIDLDKSGTVELEELKIILLKNKIYSDSETTKLIEYINSTFKKECLDYYDFSALFFRSNSSSMRMFDRSIKNLLVHKSNRVMVQDFVVMLNITDPILVNKLTEFSVYMDTFQQEEKAEEKEESSGTRGGSDGKDPNLGTFDFDDFVEKLFRGTDKMLFYKSYPWYKKIKMCNKFEKRIYKYKSVEYNIEIQDLEQYKQKENNNNNNKVNNHSGNSDILSKCHVHGCTDDNTSYGQNDKHDNFNFNKPDVDVENENYDNNNCTSLTLQSLKSNATACTEQNNSICVDAKSFNLKKFKSMDNTNAYNPCSPHKNDSRHRHGQIYAIEEGDHEEEAECEGGQMSQQKQKLEYESPIKRKEEEMDATIQLSRSKFKRDRQENTKARSQLTSSYVKEAIGDCIAINDIESIIPNTLKNNTYYYYQNYNYNK